MSEKKHTRNHTPKRVNKNFQTLSEVLPFCLHLPERDVLFHAYSHYATITE